MSIGGGSRVRPDRTSAAAVGLAGGLLLMAAAVAVPAVTGWNVRVHWFPPLHARWDPRLGPGSVPALAVGALAVRWGLEAADRLPWRRLLMATYAAGLAWMLSLALVDGWAGVARVLEHRYEYLRTARAVTDVPAMLAEYVDRIPYAAADNWPVHVAGHPPGAVLVFVALARVGLGGGLAAGLVVTAVAASTAVAVLVTLRELGSEQLARRAAPFGVFAPAAVWQCVSADGMFAAVAGWGIAALAVAAVRRSPVWAVVAGVLLGYCVMLSYGLPLLGLLALAVLVAARSWRPLVPAVLAATAIVVAFAVAGFAWWEALPVLRDRYLEGVGGRRPAAYWTWADLAALAFGAGPLAFAGVTHALAGFRGDGSCASGRAPARRRAHDPHDDDGRRTIRWLTAAGVAMVVTADLSQMSRGEVERIWLPFVPWLLVSCALLPAGWRRPGLALQVVTALLVQHLLWTDW